jgi:hypothetical protein
MMKIASSPWLIVSGDNREVSSSNKTRQIPHLILADACNEGLNKAGIIQEELRRREKVAESVVGVEQGTD